MDTRRHVPPTARVQLPGDGARLRAPGGASRSRVSFYTSVSQFWVVQLSVAAAVGVVFVQDIRLVFLSVPLAKVASGVALGLYFLYARRAGVFEGAAKAIDEAPGD